MLRKKNGYGAVLVMAAGLWVLILGGSGFGAEAGITQQRSIVATIEQKVQGNPSLPEPGVEPKGPPAARAMVIIAAERRYHIIRETRVLGTEGQEIGIDALPVPCEAKITYQFLTRNDPNVLQIEVRRVLPGATSGWARPQPQ